MDLKATLAKLRQRAATDPAFRQELEKDATAVVTRETGLTLDELRQHMQQLTDDELAELGGGYLLKYIPQYQKWKKESKMVCFRCGFTTHFGWELDLHLWLDHGIKRPHP